MFSFFQTIVHKMTTVIAAAAIAIGLISVSEPPKQPVLNNQSPVVTEQQIKEPESQAQKKQFEVSISAETEKLKKEIESLRKSINQQNQSPIAVNQSVQPQVQQPQPAQPQRTVPPRPENSDEWTFNWDAWVWEKHPSISPPVSVVPPTPIPTPTPSLVITLAVPIIPSSIKVSTNKLNNYMEIALNPQIEHNERIDIIATVKDIAGNPAPNQTVIFENGYSSAKSITDSGGIADVCFIADSGGFVGGQVVYRQTSIIARVVIPANSTFIQDTILVNAPIDQNLGNLNRIQQGHLYEFRCQ